MASAKRIAANRRNAQKSTGPRSAAGKARASRNARRHGLAGAALTPEEADKAAPLADALRAEVEASSHVDAAAAAAAVFAAAVVRRRAAQAALWARRESRTAAASCGPGDPDAAPRPPPAPASERLLQRYDTALRRARDAALRRFLAAARDAARDAASPDAPPCGVSADLAPDSDAGPAPHPATATDGPPGVWPRRRRKS
ncbi:hypothetical protein [Alsobacter sp. SYSU BS001988]